jgi:8-oxo-dGTP pyrophosphatase MutT (NUDIX family)
MSKKKTSDSVRERASVICVHRGRLLLVDLEDPGSKKRYLFPPGGHIEKNEIPEETAIRETHEETGHEVELLYAQAHSLHYEFEWNLKKVECLTHFFFGRLLNENPSKVVDAPYHKGVVWVALEALPQHLNYHPSLCEMVRELALSFPIN